MLHDPQDASLFPRLPEDEVRNLARYGTEVRLADGELLFSEEEPPRDFFVVLEGKVRISKRIGGEETTLAVHGRGEFTGDVSLITGRRQAADARAVGPSRACRIAAEDFARVMAENPAVAGIVFRAVAGRAEELGAQMHQRARLVALGTMSAGLAHELNNPAAAASRAASRLGENLQELRGLALALNQHDFTSEQRGLLTSALDAAGNDGDAPADVLDPLARSDREDELAGWLDSRGVEDAWNLAPTLAEAGLHEEALEGILGRLPSPVAADALAWLASTLEAEGYAREVSRATAQVSDLVETMKQYTYMDQAPLQDVDLREGLENTLAVLGHRFEAGVGVVRDYERDLPRIPARGSELNEVWTNLLENALDAVGGEGTIRVRAAREGDRVLVEIADDGPGIPEEIKDRVFEPFFTTKGPGGGPGLGLDTARRVVVNGHGGDLRVESRPGETRFQVRLPVGD